MNKKEVSINKIVKSIIIGFASYGIIFYVMMILIFVLASKLVGERININDNRVVMSVIAAIFLFLLIRFICRVSTIDAFKKCYVDKESHGRICKKLSLFYVICIALCIFSGLALLSANLKFERSLIEYYKVLYSQDEFFVQEHVDQLEREYLQEYDAKKNVMIISTIAVELGLTFGFLSLINYQGKMIERYNNYISEAKSEDNSNNENGENVAAVEEQTVSNEDENKPVEEEHKEEDTNNEKNDENVQNDDDDIDKMAEEIKNLT